jgi:hypothetical protein
MFGEVRASVKQTLCTYEEPIVQTCILSLLHVLSTVHYYTLSVIWL